MLRDEGLAVRGLRDRTASGQAMSSATFRILFVLTIAMPGALRAAGDAARLVLHAVDFGLVADGKTDDGPAIRSILGKAMQAGGPVTIRFPEAKLIYIATGEERYGIRLHAVRGLQIDGGGSTFLVHKDIRFLRTTGCTDLQLSRFQVDVTPSPVIEGTVEGIGPDQKSLFVKVDEPERVLQLGGPTREDGEQSFYGMLWLPGRYAMESAHYGIRQIAPAPDRPGVVQVLGEEQRAGRIAERVQAGKTRISLPVAGIAHRHGPGAMFVIEGCRNVTVEGVEVWAAPWFAYQIFRNEGELVFRSAHVRPKPGSGRITSSWRDGFHVKGNSGKLRFEDCILEGMNDDSFNVSTHGWRVTQVLSENRIQVAQHFPIQYMPMRVGGELRILAVDGRRLLNGAIIRQIRETPRPNARPDHAPNLELTLDRLPVGIEKGCLLWDMSCSNPDTVIRRCRIGNSCRFRSPVTLENCDVSALLFFQFNATEGPTPSGSVIRDCVLRQGRGNRQNAVVFEGWLEGSLPKPQLPPTDAFPLRNILVENCRVQGGLTARGVAGLVLRGNRFTEGDKAVNIRDCPAN